MRILIALGYATAVTICFGMLAGAVITAIGWAT